MLNKIPNLFIVGAARSGTTFLWSLLRQHPDIFFGNDRLVKEPGFFSNLRGIKNKNKYLNLFALATDQKYIGEASTAYITDPISAQLIYEFNPASKIIILLRNPIHRAYSLYKWMLQDGYEYCPTFEDALRKEKERQYKRIPNLLGEHEYYYNYMYFKSGLYSKQIDRYVDVFGRKNIFIGLFEDFIENTETLLRSIYLWLEIENHSDNHKSTRLITNSSKQTVNPYLSFGLRKIVYLIQLLIPFKMKSSRDFIFELLRKNADTRPMSKHTYKMLHARYKDEYSILQKKYSIDIDIWEKYDYAFLQ